MNYYDHHIGDYAAATEHLTWIEDMAYTRLIRMYYRTEKPIPSDIAQVCRLVRAASKQERDAVASVLAEFFTLREDGWHQKRCDEELARMHSKSGKARESAAKRWQSEGNANAMRTHSEGNAPNNQEPIAKSQEPIKEKARSVAAVVLERPDWLPAEWEEYERHRIEKRAKLTVTARNGCIKRLDDWRRQGHDIVAILRHSIDNGYTGLFEPPPKVFNAKGGNNQAVADAWARGSIDGTAERVDDAGN